MEGNGEERSDHDDEWLDVDPGTADDSVAGPFSEQKVRVWALVLDARGVPCSIAHDDSGWHLQVPARSLSRARRELRIYERKNRNWPPPDPVANPLAENNLVTVSVLILLASFYNITRLAVLPFGISSPDWTGLGSAHAGLILHYGEWWRLVTALTLHADWLHLVSNVTIGGIFIMLLCGELGSGLSWLLLITSGMLGNLVNACLQRPSHDAVGASTAVFAAVGMLAALGAVHYRHHLRRRWPLPIAAALALLALLGTEGKNTDLGAHLFGFLFGLLSGHLAQWAEGRFGRPGRLLNALLALTAVGIVVAAWWAALVLGRE